MRSLICTRRITGKADQYSGLESLGSSLTALSLRICDSVPNCLGELTALRSLGECQVGSHMHALELLCERCQRVL